MSTHPNLMFDSFCKTAAAAAMRPAETSGAAGMGDSMQKLKSERSSKPQWSTPNPSQATPSENPIAAQKIAPPPPVQ